MDRCKLTTIAILLLGSCLSGGCRTPVDLHGRSLSWGLVPMYKQPAGYSSSFHDRLKMSAAVVDYGGGIMTPAPLHPYTPVPAVEEPADVSTDNDRVIIPAPPIPCGPICEQPETGNGRR